MTMLLNKVCLRWELRNLSRKCNFRYTSPGAVLSVLDRIAESRTLSCSLQIGREEREIILIWEKAAMQASENTFMREKWRKVMARCNSVLCSTIPKGKKDPYLMYIRDIMRAA